MLTPAVLGVFIYSRSLLLVFPLFWFAEVLVEFSPELNVYYYE